MIVCRGGRQATNHLILNNAIPNVVSIENRRINKYGGRVHVHNLRKIMIRIHHRITKKILPVGLQDIHIKNNTLQSPNYLQYAVSLPAKGVGSDLPMDLPALLTVQWPFYLNVIYKMIMNVWKQLLVNVATYEG